MHSTPAAPPPPTPREVDATVFLLAVAAFISGCALRICDGLIPRLAADFAITPGQGGGVVLTFSVAYGLSQLAFGPLGDRYGKVRMMCFALFGCSAGALASAFAGSFDQLLALRALWGITAAGVIPLGIAWVGDAVPYESRQATLAKLLMGTLTGMTAGQLGGGLFADSAWGWRGAFATLAVGFLAMALLLLARLRGIHAAPAVPAHGRFAFLRQIAAVLRVPWARVVLAAVLAEGIFLLGPLAFLPSYLHQRFGVSLTGAAALMSLYAVGGLVYAMLARHLVRRLGERRMAAAGGVIMALGFVAWYLAPAAVLAGPVALAVGFGTYLYHNTLQTHGTQMAPQSRGSAMACFAFCLFTGQAIGVSLAGVVFDHLGPAALLLIPAVGLALAGAGFAHALHRRNLAP